MKTYTARQVAALDRYTIKELGVDLRQLMEIAGMRSAEIVVEMIKRNTTVVLLAGPGGNGGDALVCAKWLKLWGYDAMVLLSHERERLKPVTAHQLQVWEKFGGRVEESGSVITNCDCIVDGLLGYSLEGAPQGRSAELILWANALQKPILALDVPSGMDATTGEARDPCITAERTVVYGVMKKGLLAKGAGVYTGKLDLIDIGFPREFPESIVNV